MAHIHEKIDFTVCVYIVHKNKVLLRMHDKYNIWLPPGGHIELDEDPIQAALREAKEEAGLDVVLWDGNQKYKREEARFRELIPPVGLNRHRISDTHEHIDLVYLGTSNTDVIKPAEGEGNAECRWLTKEELDTLPLLTDVKFHAALALDTLGDK